MFLKNILNDLHNSKGHGETDTIIREKKPRIPGNCPKFLKNICNLPNSNGHGENGKKTSIPGNCPKFLKNVNNSQSS